MLQPETLKQRIRKRQTQRTRNRLTQRIRKRLTQRIRKRLTRFARCRAALHDRYNAGVYNNEENFDAHMSSIVKLKEILHSPNKIHVFGDANHGDDFIDFLKLACAYTCFTEEEMAILRNSVYFAESMHVKTLREHGFLEPNLISVDTVLNLNACPMNRMECVNEKWTDFIFDQYRPDFPYKYFILLGRSHLYASKKSEHAIVPSFPWYFNTMTELDIKPYVLYIPELPKYTNANVLPNNGRFIELIDFPYIHID